MEHQNNTVADWLALAAQIVPEDVDLTGGLVQTRPLTVLPCEARLFLGVWRGEGTPFMHSLVDLGRVASVLYAQGLD